MVYYPGPHHGPCYSNKKKLLARISRIRGQINGIEKALNEERECGEVLLTLAACRGAMNALMAESWRAMYACIFCNLTLRKTPAE